MVKAETNSFIPDLNRCRHPAKRKTNQPTFKAAALEMFLLKLKQAGQLFEDLSALIIC